MKAISKLKDEARRHEHGEEWEKAIQVYLQVLRVGEHGEAELELPLYNRVGDLYVRVGRWDDAVTYYEQAADRYADAGLYNNAIALCNKALRYQPDHLDLLRKLGQFSASHGFLIDARRYFLQFAEKKFAAGAVNDALAALADFADVSEDPEIREMLGGQLQSHGRTAEATAELQKAYFGYTRAGQTDRAGAVLETLRAMDPAAAVALVDPPAAAPAAERDAAARANLRLSDFEFESVGPHAGLAAEPTPQGLIEGLESTQLRDAADDTIEADLPGQDWQEIDESEDAGAAGAGTLDGLESTTLDFGAAAAEFDGADPGLEMERDETSFDLPAPGHDSWTEPDAAAPELPSLDESGEDSLEEAVGFELPALDGVDLSVLDGQAFDLPDLDDEEGAIGAWDFLSMEEEEVEEDLAGALELPGLEEEEVEEDLAGAPELPGLDEEEDVLGAPDLTALHDPDEVLDAVGTDDILGTMAGDAVSMAADVPPSLLGEPGADADAGLEELPGAWVLDVTAEEERAEAAAAEMQEVADSGWVDAAAAEPGQEADAPDVDHGSGATDSEQAAGAGDSGHGPPTFEPPTDEEFIDLGALIAEDDEPKTTRFRVRETEPTGDEEKDFAELLTQFKSRVSESLPPEDAAAHYDLGLAFKDMGLIDEAISEYQVALRGGHKRLKVFEELGECFLQKQQYNIAEKVLRRGMELEYDDELELLGVYYYLGRAYEGLGRSEQARDAYERVLSMDINFQDVSERLSRL
jgi:tetratricopeptide (TPR) repeat protein